MNLFRVIKNAFVPIVIFCIWFFLVFLIVRATMSSIEMDFTNFRWELYRHHFSLNIAKFLGFSGDAVDVTIERTKHIKSYYRNSGIVDYSDVDNVKIKNNDWKQRKVERLNSEFSPDNTSHLHNHLGGYSNVDVSEDDRERFGSAPDPKRNRSGLQTGNTLKYHSNNGVSHGGEQPKSSNKHSKKESVPSSTDDIQHDPNNARMIKGIRNHSAR